ncbi:hypothetical protein NDU88_004073 [Pleurodeles waltl]|uniref:Uncharacterized protein n=1 Tax=Pleurodeles waltl TaxID=8319 RepID=A0AAV7W724_PLEWA|nr:hypothetical protein NDU88_004073 [Pleurodeles waltl]
MMKTAGLGRPTLALRSFDRGQGSPRRHRGHSSELFFGAAFINKNAWWSGSGPGERLLPRGHSPLSILPLAHVRESQIGKSLSFRSADRVLVCIGCISGPRTLDGAQQ